MSDPRFNGKDKLEVLFETKEDVLKKYYIDFDKGIVYSREAYNKGNLKKVGRPTTGNLYERINVTCPNHTHIWKRGCVDVLSHRLIFYAFHGFVPIKVDHDDKKDPFPNRVQNLKVSDDYHNRMNTEKIEIDLSNITDPIQREIKKYRCIYYVHNYYWARFKGEYINENGFISAILAVNFRNEYIKKDWLKRYGTLDNLPINALDQINSNDLFLDQMLQEAQESTQEYWIKQENIKIKFRGKKEKEKEIQDCFEEFV